MLCVQFLRALHCDTSGIIPKKSFKGKSWRAKVQQLSEWPMAPPSGAARAASRWPRCRSAEQRVSSPRACLVLRTFGEAARGHPEVSLLRRCFHCPGEVSGMLGCTSRTFILRCWHILNKNRIWSLFSCSVALYVESLGSSPNCLMR